MSGLTNRIVAVKAFSGLKLETVVSETNSFLERLALNDHFEFRSVDVKSSGSATTGGALKGASNQTSAPVYLATIVYSYPSGENPLE